MDPLDPSQIPDDDGGGGGEEKRALRILTRCGCGIILSLGISFFLSIAFVLVAIGIGNFTAKSPVSVPAICRIVSSIFVSLKKRSTMEGEKPVWRRRRETEVSLGEVNSQRSRKRRGGGRGRRRSGGGWLRRGWRGRRLW